MPDTSVPMILCLNRQPVGRILSYGYETPWACGRFEPGPQVPWQGWVEACELSQELEGWPEAESREQDDLRWNEALARRGLDEAFLDSFQGGDWLIRCRDGSEHAIPAPPDFDRKGFVTWRW